ncbi:MAG: hypothetical protein ABI588_02865 [Arenimonas sp.]
MSRGPDRHEDARRRTRRARIAFEAARLMATQGLQDAREATRRAARQLGEDQAQGLPLQAEVLEQLRDYQRLFQADSQPAALRRRREAALQAMAFLQAFEPRLVGAVLDGSADEHSPVRLQVFAEDPEAFARFLAELGWPHSTSTMRVQSRRDQPAQTFTAWHFLAGGLPFEVVALPTALLRQPPPGPDGRAMERASSATVRAMLDASD